MNIKIYPVYVQKEELFIIRRQLLYMQHMVFTMHLHWLAANTIGVELCSTLIMLEMLYFVSCCIFLLNKDIEPCIIRQVKQIVLEYVSFWCEFMVWEKRMASVVLVTLITHRTSNFNFM